MKKILIICPFQLGELIDSYYWAKYSADLGYDVTYLGYKYKQRRMKPIYDTSFKTITVLRDTNYLKFIISFFYTIFKTIKKYHFENIIIVHFPGCFIIPLLFPKLNIVYDIRTASVSPSPKQREKVDSTITKYSSYFRTVSVISEGVAKHLKLQNYKLLPLGAVGFAEKKKKFDKLKLFYIGTFNNRNLDILLEGLYLFKNKYGIFFTFDMVGGGLIAEEEKLIQIISSHSLHDIVKIHGFLNHKEARYLFEQCNVGISFVPIIPCYEDQPPTKTYEYLLSGMPCLATNTRANKSIINTNNGVLVDDSPEDVCRGLKQLYDKFLLYDSEKIKESVEKFHWEKIVRNYFITLFQ